MGHARRGWGVKKSPPHLGRNFVIFEQYSPLWQAWIKILGKNDGPSNGNSPIHFLKNSNVIYSKLNCILSNSNSNLTTLLSSSMSCYTVLGKLFPFQLPILVGLKILLENQSASRSFRLPHFSRPTLLLYCSREKRDSLFRRNYNYNYYYKL